MLFYIEQIVCIGIVSVSAINRPVYKVVLTQKGYAQFLQYDVETPPLREFTFCTWIRVYDLENDQTIFTYVAKGNHRITKLWLSAGGHYMKVSINERVMSNFPVDIMKDVWRHVCLSYQSDYGAWALYIDSRLASCEAAQSLNGFIFPRGGSVIVGYGTTDDGISNGFEGEIYGANMILMSTIERNYTMRENPIYEQKLFPRNKVKNKDNNNNYIILGDLQTDEIHNNFEKIFVSPPTNFTKSYIKFHTPYSNIEHDVGLDLSTTKLKNNKSSNEKELLDSTIDKFRTTETAKENFFNLMNQASSTGNFKMNTKSSTLSVSSTKDHSVISEYETPPPIVSTSFYFDKSVEVNNIKQGVTKPVYNLKDSTKNSMNNYSSQKYTELSEIETPPPIDKNNKVYGQWTSSKYAGTVLNYLKSINFQNRDKLINKVPPTISLSKVSDAYPYASDLIISKLRPPSHFNRRNIVEKRSDIVKKHPQLNVQILEDDLRSNIRKMHANTRPRRVEITNRGEGKKKMDHRYYRNVNYDSVDKFNSAEDSKPRPFALSTNIKTKYKYSKPSITKQKHNSVLPFLKSLEYHVADSETTEPTTENSEDMYSKSLAAGNKWHNVKSYSNDYTPRRINIQSEEDTNLKHHPSIRLKYKHEKEVVEEDDDPTIVKGRKLADEVSNQSDFNTDSISLLKYNHGYLPTQNTKVKGRNKIRSKPNTKRNMNKNNFNKHVKIGNALNEKHVLGIDEEKKKLSFLGGFDNIPDINRYRSDIDNENGSVPSSLSPRVCKNVELYDRVLYVQMDESIDMTHILSPVRAKNLAIEFILQNYKKCSLAESSLERNSKLYIDWSKTPVRLFGGAYPRTTTDLCGFF